jgi:UDP-N-acetylmuramoylalanine--D-glutamate ligase
MPSQNPPESSVSSLRLGPDLWPGPVAVLGYGVEGKSTLRHLLGSGRRDVVVLDRTAPSEGLPEGVQGVFGEDYLRGLESVATAFRSPGLRPFVPEIEAFRKRGGLLTSQLEAAFRLKRRDRILGVTGTVGKGTCCSLLSDMLDAGGVSHRLAGNIGLPILDALEDLDPDAWLVLELSSFQLSTAAESPAAAIVLRTTTEHLDWHADRKEYWDHKANLVRFQKPGDFCVYFADADGSRAIGAQGAGRKLAVGAGGSAGPAAPTGARLGDTEAVLPDGLRIVLAETRMTGAFNLENLAAAAVAARELGAPPEAVLRAARAFSPLEHRIEFVREARGVRYYHDSYATRPEATLGAVRGLRGAPDGNGRPPGAVGLILGGSEKFADFSELAEALAGEAHLRAVAFIGQTAERLEAELERAGALKGRAFKRCATLEEALEFLRGEIREGAILLSPACASFGLFANYKERGKAFKKLVNELPG